MGAMTSPGRAHLLAFEAPNLLMSSYPLVQVPTFAEYLTGEQKQLKELYETMKK